MQFFFFFLPYCCWVQAILRRVMKTWRLTVDHSQQNSGFCDDYHPYFLPGCTTTGLSLNSRTFSKMLQTCPYLCGRHRVILEAEERYKKKLQKSSDSNKRHAAYESNCFLLICFLLTVLILLNCGLSSRLVWPDSDHATLVSSLVLYDLPLIHAKQGWS